MPRTSTYRAIWRNHRLHHFKNEHFWHGITNNLSDRVLGTNPDQREVPEVEHCAHPRPSRMSLDERWIRSLHVEAMRHADLHAEHDPHVLFQASTIGALIDGSFEGDVTFAELAEHGDLGLGTLNHLDGEMIAIDGRFYRADVEGNVTEVPGGRADAVRRRRPLRIRRSSSTSRARSTTTGCSPRSTAGSPPKPPRAQSESMAASSWSGRVRSRARSRPTGR